MNSLFMRSARRSKRRVQTRGGDALLLIIRRSGSCEQFRTAHFSAFSGELVSDGTCLAYQVYQVEILSNHQLGACINKQSVWRFWSVTKSERGTIEHMKTTIFRGSTERKTNHLPSIFYTTTTRHQFDIT